jgi:hypothetical protein
VVRRSVDPTRGCTVRAAFCEPVNFGTARSYGKRTAFIVFDMTHPSQLLALSEPLFSAFNARVEIFPVMDRNDLQHGLSQLGSSCGRHPSLPRPVAAPRSQLGPEAYPRDRVTV